MIYYDDLPEDFDKSRDIVACFVEHYGRFLILKRLPHKRHGCAWGLPAGKREKNESITDAMRREAREEIGIDLDTTSLTREWSLFVRHPDMDFVYHSFSARLDERPAIHIEPTEHSSYRWVTASQALKLPLVTDLDECIRLHFRDSARTR